MAVLLVLRNRHSGTCQDLTVLPQQSRKTFSCSRAKISSQSMTEKHAYWMALVNIHVVVFRFIKAHRPIWFVVLSRLEECRLQNIFQRLYNIVEINEKEKRGAIKFWAYDMYWYVGYDKREMKMEVAEGTIEESHRNGRNSSRVLHHV